MNIKETSSTVEWQKSPGFQKYSSGHYDEQWKSRPYSLYELHLLVRNYEISQPVFDFCPDRKLV